MGTNELLPKQITSVVVINISERLARIFPRLELAPPNHKSRLTRYGILWYGDTFGGDDTVQFSNTVSGTAWCGNSGNNTGTTPRHIAHIARQWQYKFTRALPPLTHLSARIGVPWVTTTTCTNIPALGTSVSRNIPPYPLPACLTRNRGRFSFTQNPPAGAAASHGRRGLESKCAPRDTIAWTGCT